MTVSFQQAESSGYDGFETFLKGKLIMKTACLKYLEIFSNGQLRFTDHIKNCAEKALTKFKDN